MLASSYTKKLDAWDNLIHCLHADKSTWPRKGKALRFYVWFLKWIRFNNGEPQARKRAEIMEIVVEGDPYIASVAKTRRRQ